LDYINEIFAAACKYITNKKPSCR